MLLKSKTVIASAICLQLAACAEVGSPSNAFMMEKTDTPEVGASVTYQHCVQGAPGNEASVQAMYRLTVGEIEFDAASRASGGNFSSPPVVTNSAVALQSCPAGARAVCDRGSFSDHYYVDSRWVLILLEANCRNAGNWGVSP